MSNEEIIKNSLSAIRLSKYLQATGNTADALKLYLWNSEISAALLTILKFMRSDFKKWSRSPIRHTLIYPFIKCSINYITMIIRVVLRTLKNRGGI